MSESQSTTGVCGPIEMSIDSVPSGENSVLTTTELSINKVNGTISVWTAIDATVGNHTVTVTARLENYSVYSSQTFTLTIKPRLPTFSGVQSKPAFNPSLKNVTM